LLILYGLGIDMLFRSGDLLQVGGFLMVSCFYWPSQFALNLSYSKVCCSSFEFSVNQNFKIAKVTMNCCEWNERTVILYFYYGTAIIRELLWTNLIKIRSTHLLPIFYVFFCRSRIHLWVLLPIEKKHMYIVFSINKKECNFVLEIHKWHFYLHILLTLFLLTFHVYKDL
jgi:hypothetical protein